MNVNDTPLNFLASYAYLGPSKDFTESFFNLHRTGRANAMIDCGAFTLHNAKQAREWLTLDNYCDFLNKWGDCCEKYVMLDVVGNAQQSKINYETMVSRGLRPMFVLTMFDKEWEYVSQTMSVNKDICVAGGVTVKNDWLIKRFQDTMKYTSGKARIHGLGYVTFPNLFRAPIVSGDSSSWKAQPLRFGGLSAFVPGKGLKGQAYRDIWRGEKMLPEIKQALNEIEVTPAEFVKKQNHVGDYSIGALLSLVSYLKYQRYSQKHNRQLFLAISSKTEIDKLMWVNDNNCHVTYAKFREEFVR